MSKINVLNASGFWPSNCVNYATLKSDVISIA